MPSKEKIRENKILHKRPHMFEDDVNPVVKDNGVYIVCCPSGDVEYDIADLETAQKFCENVINEYAKAGNHPDDCIAIIYKQVAVATLETKFEYV